MARAGPRRRAAVGWRDGETNPTAERPDLEPHCRKTAKQTHRGDGGPSRWGGSRFSAKRFRPNLPRESATTPFRAPHPRPLPKRGVVTLTEQNRHGSTYRFFHPIGREEGRAMKRLNVVDFYEVGAALSRLGNLVNSAQRFKITDVWWPLQTAADALEKFAEQDAFQLARSEARALSLACRTYIATHVMTQSADGNPAFRDTNTEVDSWTFYSVRTALESFTHVFKAECRDNETYFIERKAIYDTACLVSRASDKIHTNFREYIAREAMQEIDESGRCFAVDSYTACGFHALRGLEIVMEDYYEAVAGKKPKFRSWYDYVKAFTRLASTRGKRKSKYPSPKVAAMIDRIREFDRNPLMHPRDTLDEPGADTVFNISIATITEMAKDMRDLKANPEQPSLPGLASAPDLTALPKAG
jgi:hypothetical protein